MIRATFKIAGWLALGGATLAGLYWLFLNTPESNALTLTASSLLVLAISVGGAITVNGAVLLASGGGWGASIRSALLGIPWFVVATIPVIATWMVVSRGDAWIERHSGEISAWFIAQLGWADVTPLLRIEIWLSRWLRWVAIPIAALCLLAALLHDGARAVAGVRWLRRAWHWRTLLVATIVFVALVALPWQLTMWRPALPATWVQPTVAGLRLAAVVVIGLIGCALLVTVAIPVTPTSTSGGIKGPPPAV